jgi:hypothetical protein
MGILFLFRSATALESIAARRSFALARVSAASRSDPVGGFCGACWLYSRNAAAEFWRGTVA